MAEGAKYVPETEEFLAEVGMLIDPEDEQFIVDRQTEEALLASEFTGALAWLGAKRLVSRGACALLGGSSWVGAGWRQSSWDD